ncbi:hypothetical protein BGZ59_008225 [Podila verticillata]|nr:hypothetical protein BGZ59_008225 [Podila verticillata]
MTGTDPKVPWSDLLPSMDMDTDTRATKEIILETIRATTKEIIKETIKDIKATKATRVTTTMATTITTNRDHLTSTLSLATILDLDPLARFTMAVAVALFDVEDSETQDAPGAQSGVPGDGPQGRPFGSGLKGLRYPPRQEAPNGVKHTPSTWPSGSENARRPNERPQDRWQRDSSKPQHPKPNSGSNYGSAPRERGHFNQNDASGGPSNGSRDHKLYREKHNGTTHTNQPPQQPPQQAQHHSQPAQPAQPVQPAQPYTHAQGYAYPPEGYPQGYPSDPSAYAQTPGYPPGHQATAPVSVTQAQAQAQAYATAYQAYASGYQAPTPSTAYYQASYPTPTYQGGYQSGSGYPPATTAANPAYPGYDYGAAYTAPVYPPVPVPAAGAHAPVAGYSGYAQYR